MHGAWWTRLFIQRGDILSYSMEHFFVVQNVSRLNVQEFLQYMRVYLCASHLEPRTNAAIRGHTSYLFSKWLNKLHYH